MAAAPQASICHEKRESGAIRAEGSPALFLMDIPAEAADLPASQIIRIGELRYRAEAGDHRERFCGEASLRMGAGDADRRAAGMTRAGPLAMASRCQSGSPKRTKLSLAGKPAPASIRSAVARQPPGLSTTPSVQPSSAGPTSRRGALRFRARTPSLGKLSGPPIRPSDRTVLGRRAEARGRA